MSTLKKPRVSVTKENHKGRNINFIDNKTRKEMTRAQFSDEIDAGNYPDYQVKIINGLRTPVSKPNGTQDDNLG